MDTVFFKKNYTKEYYEDGQKHKIIVEADITSLGNQHPYFSITADIYYLANNRHWVNYSCGCLHDEISRLFPSLTKFIPWHLVSVDEPLYYIQNSLYWAGLCGWTDGTQGSPPNLEYLKSTCLWEGGDFILRLLVGSDSKKNPINKIKALILTKILESRLVSVQARFLSAMAELFGNEVYTLPETWKKNLR